METKGKRMPTGRERSKYFTAFRERLTPLERSCLRKVLERQLGKRKDEGGWVPPEDLNNFTLNLPALLNELTSRRFLIQDLGRYGRTRFKIPHGVEALPEE
jgi:hypothetical protein